MSAILVKFGMDVLGVQDAVAEDLVPQVVTGVFLVIIVLLLVFAIYAFGWAIRSTNTRSSGFLAGVDSAKKDREEQRKQYEARISHIEKEHARDMREMSLKFEAVMAVLEEVVALVPSDRQGKLSILLLRLRTIQDIAHSHHQEGEPTT